MAFSVQPRTCSRCRRLLQKLITVTQSEAQRGRQPVAKLLHREITMMLDGFLRFAFRSVTQHLKSSYYFSVCEALSLTSLSNLHLLNKNFEICKKNAAKSVVFDQFFFITGNKLTLGSFFHLN